MDVILFDWDGTLADTLTAIYRANQAVMAELGLPFDLDRYRRHFAPDWRLMYERLGVPPDRLDTANRLWWTAMADDRAELFPGTRAALEGLAGAGHRLGIVTAGQRDRVAGEIDRLGIARLFEAVVYGDDVAAQKPDPAPLRRALAGLGRAVRPSAAVYVGDTPDDMRMATAAGTRAVGIESILGDDAELRAAGAGETAATAVDWIARAYPVAVSRAAG